MAIEPVNERPIFPSLTRLDAVGVGHWSVSMIRQLTTVFQQYGYKLNQTLLDEDLDTEGGEVVTIGGDPVLRDSDLAANGGSIPEVDRTNTWVPAQVFQTAPTATGHPLRWDELAANGGTIPETDRLNDFTAKQTFSKGAGVLELKSDGSSNHVYLEFYAKDVDLNSRSGWFGYGSSTSDVLSLTNAIGTIRLNDTGGVTVGSPGGGPQGSGTLNAQGVYDDGTLLTDYVFDAEIDERVNVGLYDRAVPDRKIKDENGGTIRTEKRSHTPARQFSQNMDELDPKGFEQKWRSSRKLPAMARAPEKPSLGEYAQALLETCEVQAVHIAKLEARIQALEDKQ